jgi:DNA mismatch endonuclease, patch repair protein
MSAVQSKVGQFDTNRTAPIPAASNSPAPLNASVSAQMARMPTKSTGPEVRLRREMHRMGLRFRLHPKDLPGRPDITLPIARIAVFVDGCFWHGCPQHGTAPKNNEQWWRTKIATNVARDRVKDDQLQRMGWLVIHVWEHDDPAAAAAQIRRHWLTRRGVHK